MHSFGLVTEGPTDQVILEQILFSILKDPDLFITPQQPKPRELGNWVKVFDYCCSEELKPALGHNDFLIIQLDTDVLFRETLPEKYKIDLPSSLSVLETVEKVTQKLKNLIDDSDQFWEEHGKRFLFAISVHEIECWLLPLYFGNRHAKAAKITGCIDTLNEALNQAEGFYIHEKNLRDYSKMARKYKKLPMRAYELNPSLKIFIDRLLAVKENNIED